MAGLQNASDAHLVLNTRVFSLSVLTDQDSVDIVIGCLEALNGKTWSDIGEEVESSAESEVQRNVALSNYMQACVRPKAELSIRLRTGCCKGTCEAINTVRFDYSRNNITHP